MVKHDIPEPHDWKLKDLLGRFDMSRWEFWRHINRSIDPECLLIQEGIYRRFLFGPEIVPVVILKKVLTFLRSITDIPVGKENEFVRVDDSPGCDWGLLIPLQEVVTSPAYEALLLTDPLIGCVYGYCEFRKLTALYVTPRAYDYLGLFFGYRSNSWISISTLARYFNVHKTTIWRSISRMEKLGKAGRTPLNHLTPDKDGVPETYLNELLAQKLEEFRNKTIPSKEEPNYDKWVTKKYEEIS